MAHLTSGVTVRLEETFVSSDSEETVDTPRVLADENEAVEDGQSAQIMRIRLSTELTGLEHEQRQRIAGQSNDYHQWSSDLE